MTDTHNSATGPFMYPSELPAATLNDKKLGAERRFYTSLKEQLPCEWAVFYSLPWWGGIRTPVVYDGEIDFVVIVPDLGILVLELKGGGIRRDGAQGKWYQQIGYDEEKEIDPFRQVRRNKYFLSDRLKGLSDLANRQLIVYDAVVFPDVKFSIDSSGLGSHEQALIIDSSSIRDLTERIKQILIHCRGGESGWVDGEFVKEAIKREVTTSLSFVPPLNHRVNCTEAIIDRLTEDQMEVMNILRNNKRVLIEGCAGSGKTLLAIRKAKELAQEGKRTLFTCFNKALAEHLASQCDNVQNLEVKTFHKLASEASFRADGIRKDVTSAAWNRHIHMFLRYAMRERDDLRYQAIVVDEGQDLTPQYWDALNCALVDRDESVFYVFADSSQCIRRDGTLPTLEATCSLNRNIRNTRQIFEGWSRVCEEGARYQTAGPDGPEVERIVCRSDIHVNDKLVETLDTLVDHNRIKPSDITVLSPFKTERENLQLKKSNLKLKNGFASSSRFIGYSTISTYKGLENKIVILVDINDRFAALPSKKRSAELYVGMSRAKVHLIMIGTQAGLQPLI